jgi:two-component system, chemotaxis family, protein-glutamate methylesterase/glutaminase
MQPQLQTPKKKSPSKSSARSPRKAAAHDVPTRNATSLVVIGASAGGVEALCTLLHDLPPRLPSALLIVQHVGSSSVLPAILRRCDGDHEVVLAADGMPIHAGVIYVAPPLRHLKVNGGVLRLSAGAKENRSRPSIDVLFRSASRFYGDRVIGVVLTGTLDDGAGGLFTIHSRGGTTIVQSDAEWPEMPMSAMKFTQVDHCVPLKEMPVLLERLSHEMATAAAPREAAGETPDAEQLIAVACPDCGGPLWKVEHGSLISYRCKVGHVFSPFSFDEAHTETLERALWSASRTLWERSKVQLMTADTMRSIGNHEVAEAHVQNAAAATHDVEIIRDILQRIALQNSHERFSALNVAFQEFTAKGPPS